MPPDPLKILLVAHGLPPESVGGVEQHVEGLARSLVGMGHDVTLYARTSRDGPQGTIHEESAWGCRVFRVVYRHEGLGSLQDLYSVELLDAAFARFLSEHGPFDVAHVHHLTGVSTGILDHLQGAGIPSALTLHDYWLMCPRGQMWHRLEEVCERVEPERCAACLEPTFPLLGEHPTESVLALHRSALKTLAQADLLITPSARTLPFWKRLGVSTGRFRVVANGVDVTALKAVPPPPAAGPLRIGYLGTLIPSKGLHVLVSAFLGVRSRLPAGSRLDIHGNAVPYHGDDTYLERVLGGLPEDTPIHYHGPYATAGLARLLTGLDVVVVPALWEEAFGLTAREALAAGRPVICSRIGGLRDAFEDGIQGLLVPPGDVDALGEALLHLASDRTRLLQMAAAAGSGRRGFDEMAAELVALYKDLT